MGRTQTIRSGFEDEPLLPIPGNSKEQNTEELGRDISGSNFKTMESDRIKRNLYILQNTSDTIDLLSRHRKCRPGTIVDEALNMYFSKEKVKDEIKEAIKVQHNKLAKLK